MHGKDGENPTFDRRRFITGAVTGAASAAVAVPAAGAAGIPEPSGQARSPHGAAPPPAAGQLARDMGSVSPPASPGRLIKRPGSDLMVQALRDLGIEFVAANPGSTFEGLQESVVNYGGPPNTMPEFITALHEETSVDMASGYARAQGRPMCAMLHGTIGLQHAAMAIYQAYYAGNPMVLIAGRDDGFLQAHTANDMAAIVRSFTKWDAQPTTLTGCLEALQEAYRQAVTPPMGPTLVVIDIELQKQEADGIEVPVYRPPVFVALDEGTSRELAQRLLAAANPHINVGHLRTPEGVRAAVELAELVGASVGTAATYGPMSFPQRHPLCGPGAHAEYDFTLGLEIGPADVALMGPRTASLARSRDTSGVGFGGLRPGGSDNELLPGSAPSGEVERTLAVDAEASLPRLIHAVRSSVTPAHQRAIAERTRAHAASNRDAAVHAVRQALETKRNGWNATPVSTARIYAELWPLIRDEDWCLASPSYFSSAHHRELWAHDRPYSYLGVQAAAGIGYGAGACGGAALAARQRGRIVINIQTDGDLNYAPGVLWSAAHHRLPMLTIMHNNRAWHQELMFLEFMAGTRARGTDRAHIGTTLRDPFINYKKMAEAYGMASEGPIEEPAELRSAFERGIASVKRGEPYLIDVITQPR